MKNDIARESKVPLPWGTGALFGLLFGAILGCVESITLGIVDTTGAMLLDGFTGLALLSWPSALLLRRLRPRARRWLWVATSLLALLLPLGTLANSPSEFPSQVGASPDLLLVTLDTTRADRWEAVVGPRATELPLHRFPTARATTGLTAPSHATLWTGKHLYEHHLLNNGWSLVGGSTLPERLKRAGYTTLAAPSVIHLDPAFGFGVGFDRFATVEIGWRARLRGLSAMPVGRLLLRLVGSGEPVRVGADTLEQALALWREAASAGKPRFLWVHLFDPHYPYDPPTWAVEELEERPPAPWSAVPTPGYEVGRVGAWRAAYDAELLETWRLLEPFLAELESGPGDRPLLTVLTADHGEAFGEHGATEHGDLLYEEQLRVPFWVWGDGVQPGSTSTSISHVDLLPSLLEAVGLEDVATEGSGRSWWPAVVGSGLTESRPGFGETEHPAFANSMVVLDGWKLIRNRRSMRDIFLTRRHGRQARSLPNPMPWEGEWECYRLVDDPNELNSLPIPPALRALWQEFEEKRGRVPAGPSLDRGILNALEELGYF